MPSSWSGPLQSLHQVIETLPLLVWRARRDGAWLWASPQWQDFTGQAEADYLGDGWLQAVHPDDRQAAQTAWRSAADRQTFEVEFRVLNSREQRYYWHKTRAGPVIDESGTILEWLGTSTDIDDLKRLREQEHSLLAELQHRVRNMLGVVRALARRTADHSDTMDGFLLKFEGRINAFARTQALSTHSPTGLVNLREIVFDELMLHHLQDESQVRVDGPDVMLGIKGSNLLGLAVHELASHLVANGRTEDGPFSLAVSWGIENGSGQTSNAPVLRFTWVARASGLAETGARLDSLAHDLLHSALRYELDAETSSELGPTGLAFEVRIPLARVQDRTS
ncbi:HWE histidine kinase domain-containing protein [Blastomonas sp.]|uniref:HWE histidine kinase domain-containing protein n=1 Tax=Blastomonas sp. TaxID=1909299 RepID=UPI0026034FAE|nr:HWE histidine kinase domain-containing protein [Blastomonas sp.]MDM7956077.1 HWE histidine kinase domain-containing protein [Blastomonas sp.]